MEIDEKNVILAKALPLHAFRALYEEGGLQLLFYSRGLPL